MSQPMHPTPRSIRLWHERQAQACKEVFINGTLGPAHTKALVRWHNSHVALISKH